jgi:uncharacterized membrane protein YfcA
VRGPLFTVAVGFVSGVLSGQFGIGGGLVTTPAIRLLLGYPALIAVGTPLLVILPTALTGALSYARRGLVDVRAGIVMGVFGVAASVAGALGSDLAGGPVVMVLTAAMILWVAADMAVRARRDQGAEPVVQPETADGPPRLSLSRLAVIGLVAGFYSGLLGLGGGFVVVPALTRWLGLPLKRALGTSLVVVAVLAVPGTITHYLLGHVDLTLAAWLVLGSVPGALVGARFTAVARERTVAIAFSCVLALAGLALAGTELAKVIAP